MRPQSGRRNAHLTQRVSNGGFLTNAIHGPVTGAAKPPTGGTTLAAEWAHRESTEIEIL